MIYHFSGKFCYNGVGITNCGGNCFCSKLILHYRMIFVSFRAYSQTGGLKRGLACILTTKSVLQYSSFRKESSFKVSILKMTVSFLKEIKKCKSSSGLGKNVSHLWFLPLYNTNLPHICFIERSFKETALKFWRRRNQFVTEAPFYTKNYPTSPSFKRSFMFWLFSFIILQVEVVQIIIFGNSRSCRP